ncbi:MAG: DUF6531 domain-containing protein [Gammaproteobacteria bacterium]|nr:DUF6531 domain-containing protein [Gammaproteobacteria bacterium]
MKRLVVSILLIINSYGTAYAANFSFFDLIIPTGTVTPGFSSLEEACEAYAEKIIDSTGENLTSSTILRTFPSDHAYKLSSSGIAFGCDIDAYTENSNSTGIALLEALVWMNDGLCTSGTTMDHNTGGCINDNSYSWLSDETSLDIGNAKSGELACQLIANKKLQESQYTNIYNATFVGNSDMILAAADKIQCNADAAGILKTDGSIQNFQLQLNIQRSGVSCDTGEYYNSNIQGCVSENQPQRCESGQNCKTFWYSYNLDKAPRPPYYQSPYESCKGHASLGALRSSLFENLTMIYRSDIDANSQATGVQSCNSAFSEQSNPTQYFLNYLNSVTSVSFDIPDGYELNLATGLLQAETTQKAAGENEDCGGKYRGNPCDISTGNKFQVEVDYTSPTIRFVRYYNSLFNINTTLGKQWSHNYSPSLNVTSSEITALRGDSKALTYTEDTGVWISDPDVLNQLKADGSNWEYTTTSDAVELYNSQGQLLQITSRDGKITSFVYSNGLLETITGPFGRTLTLTYDTENRLSILTTPDNTQIKYQYDLNNNLIRVIYPDATPLDDSDNPTKNYLYEDSLYPNHLTGIIDENNIRYATWEYQADGKAILSKHGTDIEQVDITYNADGTTTVLNALGHTETFTFETHHEIRKPKTVTLEYYDGNQNISKTRNYTYNPNGFVETMQDYKGVLTRYQYNSRGLLIQQTEAEGTPEEKITTTTWHSVWRLPESITYPDKQVFYDYHPNGQLKSMTTDY